MSNLLLVGPAALAEMRAFNDANLTESAVVAGMTTVYGPGGVTTDSFVVRATLPCRLAPLGNTPQERVIAAQNGLRRTSLVIFAAGSDVRLSDRITVTGETTPGVPWTLTVEVVGVGVPLAAAMETKVVVADLPLGTTVP